MPRYFKYFLTLSLLAFSIQSYAATEAARLTPKTQQAIISHMKLLYEFKAMYENKHFDASLFDTQTGYLQTSLSSNDKMPLTFFIDYNNAWWFPILDKIVVPSVSYDYETGTGFIVLNIYYDSTHILRGIQSIKFTGNKISYIRTYASPAFFSENDVLIKLDQYGNSIWLDTGYDMDYSAKAALLFFASPKGQAFAANPKTKSAVRKIKHNLQVYLTQKRNV